MTAMVSTPLPVKAWTQAYGGGATAVTVQNIGSVDLMLRIDAAATSGDALTAAHDVLRSGEHRSLTIGASDKIFACPVLLDISGPGLINVRA